jgi:hypothetical protein
MEQDAAAAAAGAGADDSGGADAGAAARAVQGPVRFSANLARTVCRRVAAGESQASLCAEPGMPSRHTLQRWARGHAGFGRVFARAKAMAARKPVSGVGYCPATAEEIVARVSEGEMLTTICADPLMPSLRTMMRWRADHADFAEDLMLAREALAERFSDLGWKLAMEATPATAHLTRVRLAHLRWMTAVFGPRTHGRMKPIEAPQARETQDILFRHFQIEKHPQTGQHRVVGYTPDPETMQPVRTSEGDWKDPIGPVGALSAGEEQSRQRIARWTDEMGD